MSGSRTLRQRLRAWRKARRKPVRISDHYALSRRLLLDVCAVLDAGGVRYMVDQGTLIGIARDGDLLPWDDDIDLALPVDQLPRVRQLLPELRRRGWRVRFRYMPYDYHCWREGDLQAIKIRKRRWGVLRSRVRMDINIKYKSNDKYYWHSMGVACQVDARYFDASDTIEFAGQRLQVPAGYERYLQEKYGDWRTPDPDYVPRRDDGTTIGKIAPGRTAARR